MPKRYKDLYSILKHPKIKLKIGPSALAVVAADIRASVTQEEECYDSVAGYEVS